MNLSNIKFPKYITGIDTYDDEYFKGGYNYQTQHNGWTSINLVKQHLRFNDITHPTPEDPDLLEISDWVTFYKAPNGYEFQFQVSQYLNTYTSYATRILDHRGEVITGEVAGVSMRNSNYYPGVYQAWSYFEFDVYLMTQYYPDVDPLEDSPNHGLYFYISMGNPSAENNPYSFHVGTLYGNEINAFNLGGVLMQFTDLEGFERHIKNNGEPYDGDLFTDEPLPDDPAGSDDTSEPGGGDGNYDDTSDPVDFPDVPTGGALESGAVVAHRVLTGTLEDVIEKLWDTSIFNPIAMWQKSITDPMNAIVSLHCLPFTPELGELTDIWIGNFDTELKSRKIISEYKEIDCGTLNLKEYWGSALDYSPYTRVEIFLPFIGVKDLTPEDVMKAELHIKYYVDVLTGDCDAFIKCGISVLYHFTGNCRMTIPLSSSSTDLMQNALAAHGSLITGSAIGGAVGGGVGMLAGAIVSGAANIASTKIRVNRTGDVSGVTGIMDDFIPYLIIHRPVQSLAKNYNKYKGYPSNITATLSSLKGYTEVEHIHLEGIPNATDAEINEIVNLLKGGVLL